MIYLKAVHASGIHMPKPDGHTSQNRVILASSSLQKKLSRSCLPSHVDNAELSHCRSDLVNEFEGTRVLQIIFPVILSQEDCNTHRPSGKQFNPQLAQPVILDHSTNG